MKKLIEENVVKITVATLITFIIFVIITTANIITWKEQTTNCIDDVQKDVSALTESLKELDIKSQALSMQNTDFQIELAKINTQLNNIELLLTEIRMDLKVK